MGRIVLIACVSRKADYPAQARDLYQSDLFTKARGYAQSLKPDAWYILSAKHGLLAPDEVIEPYNTTLITMPIAERKAWAETVVTQLRKRHNLETDEFVFLAGERYREFITPHMKHSSVPLQGLGIGRQLAWLKARI